MLPEQFERGKESPPSRSLCLRDDEQAECGGRAVLKFLCKNLRPPSPAPKNQASKDGVHETVHVYQRRPPWQSSRCRGDAVWHPPKVRVSPAQIHPDLCGGVPFVGSGPHAIPERCGLVLLRVP